MFVVERQDAAAAAVLRLRGLLVFGDAITALRVAVSEALRDTPSPLVCDLSGVEKADSSGLAVLITAQEETRRAGRHLVFLRPGARLRAMIEIAHLMPLVDIADDENDALRRANEWRNDLTPR